MTDRPMHMISDLLAFTGRLHPLLVHLPIGILVAAGLLHAWKRLRPSSVSDAAMPFIWAAAALSAVLSALTGYVHASAGGYAEDLLASHRQGGILLAVCCSLVAGLYRFRPMATRFRLPRILLQTLTLGLLAYTGHGGGSLTHGEGYLAFTEASDARPDTEGRSIPLDSVELFRDAVMPILQKKCVGCHNPSKIKGGLLLNTHAAILKGGESGPGVVPGDLAASEVFRRVSLPVTHADFMPAEGRQPLTEQQRAILEWWIVQGAGASMPLAKTPPDGRMRALLEAYFQVRGDAVQDVSVEAASEADLAELRAAGFLVSRITAAGPWLEIRYQDTARPDLGALSRVRDQLVWLQLADCGLTDADLPSIEGLEHLIRLDLSRNRIGDAGVESLRGMGKLEYLNLYGTRVTASGLGVLAGLPRLKKLYAWDSGMDSIPAGMRIRPGLEVILRRE